MNAAQFRQVVKRAQQEDGNGNLVALSPDANWEALVLGYGLHGFQKVSVSLDVAAQELRNQALLLNGEWDAEALNNSRVAFKRAFLAGW